MEENHQSDRNHKENSSIRSDLGTVQPQEMPSSTLNSDEFPPIRTQPDRVNTSEPTRPPDSTPASISNPPPQPQKSFAEAVAAFPNSKPLRHKQVELQKFFLADSKPNPIGEKSSFHSVPTLTFSDSETNDLAASYRFALIGKFSHGTPHYRNLHRLIANLGLKGGFTISMINNKHVLICLSNESDYSHLWLRRIWYLQGFPMRVFKWTPTFTPSQESSIVPIWVSFSELPAHLYRKDALYAVASMVGNPLQIDDYTFNQSKLSQGRMCVEIDLLNPIIEEFNITIQGVSIKQKVEFEEVPKYCSLCKHVGHKDADCYSKGNAPKPPPRRQNEDRKQNTEGATLQQKQFRGKTKVHQVFDDRPERSHIHMERGECSKAGELQTDTPNFKCAIDSPHNNMQLAICKSTMTETQVFPNVVGVDDLITMNVDEHCEG
ncbi:UNVERIFIED_CONTAM: hypothetical protein Slati_2718400 [Sesamum latifolium]|uniref:DUF4283 domain-containing protein n=1 Tax=Sesamum latifolium TaxID=2727402 RepID=A0AAW2W133_9LAMI